MKLEFWHKDMIRFMTDASEYGDYYRQLTEKMQPWLTSDMHICDAGSGLGYLSLALAPYVRQVTAVEKHPDAAAVLSNNCQRLSIPNVISRCGSIDEVLPAEKYDAMVFCFFGGIRHTLELAKQQCRGDVFVFTRNYRNHRFSAGNLPTGWDGYPEFKNLLEELAIPFHQQTLAPEFGQPFRNLRDARRFFELYSKDQETSMVTEEFLRNKLVETGREDFPWYSPHQRQIAFLHFSANDIPDHIG